MLCYKTQQKGRSVWEQWSFRTSPLVGRLEVPNPFGMFATPSGTFPVPNRATPPHTPWFPCAPFPVLFLWIYPQQQPRVAPLQGLLTRQ